MKIEELLFIKNFFTSATISSVTDLENSQRRPFLRRLLYTHFLN